ncbi:RepB family plasmid replication initiator protein [Hymenobacter cavernae]|uniref:Initiator Rep protein WH1 domain-containing protein n=1 Tax=Hymenobacter cavernae TaxID=2044852 RepID=A0ABQ1UX55_9BACT|nr:RepB family plasmid replication initiator protein [Hymenobacter cavernae]GGF27978.1 hypothetical protein GCM10011383_44630 [Hymenobacter cavernae]
MPDNQYKGTTYDKSRNKWKARLRVDGMQRNLGYFDTQELAYAAIQAAKGSVPKPISVPKSIAQEPTTPENVQELITKSRKRSVVAQHNYLIEAPLALTLLEAKIFILMLRCLHKIDTKPQQIVISLEDLMGEKPGAMGGRNYDLLNAAIDNLMSVRLELPVVNRKKERHVISLVQGMRYDGTKGILVGMFSETAMPYLLHLAGEYTLGHVAELMSLSNVNTIRFYWLLKSWEFRSPITVTVEKLRNITTGKGTYTQFADYRSKVLKPSIAELNAKNFEIAYTENKKGRAVDSIEFTIKYHDQEDLGTSVSIEPTSITKQLTHGEQPTSLVDRVISRLRKLQLTEAQIKKVLQILNHDASQLEKLLKLTFPLLRDFETKSRHFDNLGASTLNLLKTNFPNLYQKTE